MRPRRCTVISAMRRTLAIVTLLAALGAPGRAAADAEEDAHGHAVRGEQLLSEKRFAAAAKAFATASRLHNLPLYQRKLGDAQVGAQQWKEALLAYQAYYAKTKDASVLKDIQRCKIALAKAGARQLGGDVVQVLLRTGKYQEAERAARKGLAAAKTAPGAHTLLAEVLLRLGKDREAYRHLREALRLDPKQHHARMLLGRHLLERDKAAEARRLLDRFFDFYSNDEIKTAADLTDLALAMRALGRFHDAHRVFGEAVKAEKSYLRAYLEWGRLLLAKYNTTEALQTFKDALKIDPENPEIHAAIARAHLEGRFNVPKALAALKKALAVNPHLAAARSLMASVHLLSEQPAKALRETARALGVNPHDREALAMEATAHYLADDRASFDRTVSRARKLGVDDARFYTTVARHAAIFHRYEEAIDLLERGLKRQPRYWPAYQALGVNYLRLGKEVKARQYLQKAWDKDPFNARTKNILDLYDESIQNYRFTLTPHFRIRLHVKDQAVMKPYVSALLERGYREMRERYGFKPHSPITVELFARQDDFAVRTVGLPRLPSHGVCFGRVVTSMSPRAGRRFNWGQVLWHELSHVFTLQLSRARVPRWLTEGLAVFEEGKGNPVWAREMDERMRRLLVTKKIRPIAELNLGFTRARTVGQIILAYYQGAQAAAFLHARVGDEGVRRILRGFGAGKNLAANLQEVLGLDPKGFDAAFKTWLTKRLEPLLKNFELDYDRYRDLEAIQKRAKARPQDPQAWAELAAARFRKKKVELAEEAVQSALKLDARHPLANYVAGELAVYRKRYDDAITAYEKVLAAGKDGYDLRRSLALLYRRKKLTAKAREHLEAAKKRNPQAVEPYLLLAKIYMGAKQTDKAIAELEFVGRTAQSQLGVLKKLVRHWAKQGSPDKVVEFGTLEIYLNPFDPKLHFELGRALGAKGETARALRELKIALVAGYKDRAEVQVEIAQLHLQAGQRAEARAAAQAALKHDAGNARAKEILQQTSAAGQPPPP